ncbi:hypothetical protein [Sorangium sp. So ce513]|uniref:hypothetical protein n=1 Tax=Sorangium sp. So ce513 TaxID=3133315 RepID=UPI003F5DA594
MTTESSLAAAGSPRHAAPAALHPALVLSAYLEPLVRGRRVAVLGDATIGLADRLLQRGARLVHAYDPDAARVAEVLARSASSRQPHPSFAVFGGDLGVRDGAFDTLVIPDLSIFDEPTEVLRRARRLTAASGAAVIASPNPDVARGLLPAGARRGEAPGYYALYDLVALQFKQVRMIGQAPFVGYTVAEFAPKGEPDVSVDTSILDGSEEPEWFIAVAGERLPRLDAFAVIELPFAGFPAASAGASPEALNEAEGRAARLGGELAELRTRHQRDREDAGARAESAVATAARLAEVEAELEAKAARLREVEGRAGDSHVRAERLTHQIRDMEEELRSQRDRATRLAKQLDDEKRLRTKVELELGMIRNRPEIAGARDRLDAATAELDAARARIAELEARPAAAAPDPALASRVEDLEAAVAAARRDLSKAAADRDAARRRAQEGERALEEAQRARREAAAKLDELARERDRLEERAGRLDRENRALEAERSSLDARRLLLEARIVELEQRVAAQEQRIAELEKRDPGEAAAAEIASLEEALRDRGHVIATLKAQLLESERVGKELVDELGTVFVASAAERGGPDDAAGGGGPGGVFPGSGGQGDVVEALRQQLDALARSAASSEADLRAAGWKVAQLERELAEARAAAGAPQAIHDELEQALIAAQAEIAALRRAAERAAEAGAAAEVTGAAAEVTGAAEVAGAAAEVAGAVAEVTGAEGQPVSVEGEQAVAVREEASTQVAQTSGEHEQASGEVVQAGAEGEPVSAEGQSAESQSVSAEGQSAEGESVSAEGQSAEGQSVSAEGQSVSAEGQSAEGQSVSAEREHVGAVHDDVVATHQDVSAVRHDVGVPPEVIEQAVLLHQVTSAVEAGV